MGRDWRDDRIEQLEAQVRELMAIVQAQAARIAALEEQARKLSVIA